jgi:glycosyltransferase involved in cell wall biosynthesis
MKVVQLITGSVSFGGAEAHVRDLTLGLIGLGHTCSVIVGGPDGLLGRQLRAQGVPVFVVPPLQKALDPIRDVDSLFQLTSLLRRLKPDILATHTAKAGFIGRLVAKFIGIPCVFTPHGQSYVNRGNGQVIQHRLLLERLALRTGATTILVSEAERQLATAHLRMDDRRVTVIHNGIPDRTPSPRNPNGPVRLTMVARFDHQKDHTFLKGLSELVEFDWEVTLAGTGPLLPAVKSLARDCGISSRVHFVGESADVPGLLADSDVFVLISNLEAFPISILEAMRAALPVVATDTGGIREALIDGENGFLVARADSRDVTEKLALLIDSPDLRSRMGRSSRTRFLEKYQWTEMLNKTEALYKRLLLHPKRSSRVGSVSEFEQTL